MKKIAIGCGIALLIVGVCAAGVAYYLYRQFSPMVAQFAELGQVGDIERNVRNRAPFTPPASEELTDAQIEKLLQVQGEIRRRLGERMASLEGKYKTLLDKQTATATDAPTIIRAYGDLAKMWIDAKRGQVEALNAANLSLDEYRWIREQAYRAIGLQYVDLDLARLADDARRGVTPESAGQLKGSIGPSGPETNRTRLEPVRKQLEDNLALASLGL